MANAAETAVGLNSSFKNFISPSIVLKRNVRSVVASQVSAAPLASIQAAHSTSTFKILTQGTVCYKLMLVIYGSSVCTISFTTSVLRMQSFKATDSRIACATFDRNSAINIRALQYIAEFTILSRCINVQYFILIFSL